MNKDFSKDKLISFPETKQIKVLYDLAKFIENNHHDYSSQHFEKLIKYHSFLEQSQYFSIQKLNKEFSKIKSIDYQFQIYLMNLERLLGQSSDEYQFMVSTQDKKQSSTLKFNIICLLDSVRSAHNVGAMLRNAECFGVEKVILCGLSPSADTAPVQKTAMGCDQEIDWSYIKDPMYLINDLKEQGYEVWSIETSPHAFTLNEVAIESKKLILIFGHEQFGVSNELLSISDKIVSISLFGNKNSLNVSVSQGIVLNHLAQSLSSSSEA